MTQSSSRHIVPVSVLWLVAGLALLLAWSLAPLHASSQAQESPLSPVAPASPLATVAAPPAAGEAQEAPAAAELESPAAEPGPEEEALPEGVPRTTSPSMALIGLVLLGLVILVGVVIWRTRTRSHQG